MPTHTHIQTQKQTHTQTHTDTHRHTQTHRHTDTQTHRHTRTHTHTHTHSLSLYLSFTTHGCIHRQSLTGLVPFPLSIELANLLYCRCHACFSLSLSIYPSIYLFISSYLSRSIYLSICPSVYLSVCLPVCLSIYLSPPCVSLSHTQSQRLSFLSCTLDTIPLFFCNNH